MALQFVKFILNENKPIFNDDPNCPHQVLCEVITTAGQKEMAFIDVESLNSCGIGVPGSSQEINDNLNANKSQKEKNFDIGVLGPSTDMTVNDLDTNKNDSVEKDDPKFVWSRSSIKCLMSTYVEFEKKFDNGKSTKIQIWNEISAKLKKFGFSVTD